MLIYKSLIFVVLTAAFNAQLFHSNSCGIRPLTSRITDGEESTSGDWGWQVSLKNSGRHFCGGVLISEKWVLTAAHCFESAENPNLSIDIGLHDVNAKETWTLSRKADKVIIHENYDDASMFNDITLLKLDNPIDFDRTYRIPACVPDTHFNVDYQTGWITGWGTEKIGGQLQTKKMQASVPIDSTIRCKSRYNNNFDSDSQLCAGKYSILSTNPGACQGDSGGPLVVKRSDGKWYLVGLISWGFDCGYGTVFTRVSYFIDWIKNNMSRN